MTRTIICVNQSNHLVDDRHCVQMKPINVTNCSKNKPKCPDWNFSEWSDCDYNTCKRYRSVICQNSTNEVDRSLCTSNQPINEEICCRFKWRSKLSEVGVIFF